MYIQIDIIGESGVLTDWGGDTGCGILRNVRGLGKGGVGVGDMGWGMGNLLLYPWLRWCRRPTW